MKYKKFLLRYNKRRAKEAGNISDQEQIAYMVTTYQNLIFSICFKITGNFFDAQDVTQETFLSAYKHFSSFDGKNEKAWLCRIATNKSIDYKRKASNRMVPTQDEFFVQMEDAKESTETLVIETAERDKLLGRCNQLKPPYNEIAKAYFYEELSISQIAVFLERNEKTVQTQVYRAKAMLQKLYGEE